MDLLQQSTDHYNYKRYKEAKLGFENLLSMHPDDVVLHHNHALCCAKLEEHEAALKSLQLPMKHGYTESYICAGAVLRSMGRYEEAMRCFAQAFVLDPYHAVAYSNYGNSLREFGKPKLAIPFFQVAQELEPNPNFRLNESIAHLLAGDLISGWEKYDARWFYDSDTSFKPNLPGIEYDGTQDIDGKKLAIYCEQGYGDAIQFARFLPAVMAKGAKITLYCRQPLIRLLQHAYPQIEVKTSSGAVDPYDLHCALMDLPKISDTTIDTIPRSSMVISDRMRDEWLTIMGKQTKPRVGIVWSSTREAWTTRFRNIPLDQMLTLKSDAIELVNLQFEMTDRQLATLRENGVKVYNQHIIDFYDTAGLISNLDLVISVDTAVVHLAATLGKPTWVLLSDYASDWRWFLDRTDSPFYPSIQLFRKGKNESWLDILDRMRKILEKMG